jgi:hypothetical protein
VCRRWLSGSMAALEYLVGSEPNLVDLGDGGLALVASARLSWSYGRDRKIDASGGGIQQGDLIVAAVGPHRIRQGGHDQDLAGGDLPRAGAATPCRGSGLMMKSSGQTVSWICWPTPRTTSCMLPRSSLIRALHAGLQDRVFAADRSPTTEAGAAGQPWHDRTRFD